MVSQFRISWFEERFVGGSGDILCASNRASNVASLRGFHTAEACIRPNVRAAKLGVVPYGLSAMEHET